MLALRARIIAVGKVKKRWILEGIREYGKRLPELEIVEVKDSTPEREAAKILEAMRPHETLVVMSERGKAMSSEEFARFMERSHAESLVFAIGGPEGTHTSLSDRSRYQLSLSAMTFTHEMARLFLVEQLYRAKSILQNTGYHRS
ncbi:MAG: 23S rRNA (pseudouridine(1915)-N(3))-methyltransferase RlmH [Synechococcales cyanobacterium T60_A2020_003]|nr:23S rRNA (pseudouridine(1915)-N(3))-methyltransferase RlmH [Synechococcales cyanobacterium T60_A2020_003]